MWVLSAFGLGLGLNLLSVGDLGFCDLWVVICLVVGCALGGLLDWVYLGFCLIRFGLLFGLADGFVN